jgi:hypothetical protein
MYVILWLRSEDVLLILQSETTSANSVLELMDNLFVLSSFPQYIGPYYNLHFILALLFALGHTALPQRPHGCRHRALPSARLPSTAAAIA